MAKVADAPPPLIVEDANGLEKLSIESHVGDYEDSGPEAMNEDDGGFNIVEKDEGANAKEVVNAYTLNPTSSEFSIAINASTCVVIAEFDVLNIIDKVADIDNKQADNLISFDTIKLFDIANMVGMQHLVSLSEPTCGIGSISHVLQFVPRSNMVEGSRDGPLLWFGIISQVQKHEREPPP
ncbi:unnamed protein product [Cuscuta campestris]|uniref:Uncharacterized protein n=1 Tax=Cuscuta campestris TaxID=132261 RepID=A0A484N509_9ASTE|nr:unnamed protein product [Cuscuta campestris]